jgi:hypothetical protein
MNTPAHLVVAAAVFAKPGFTRRNCLAILGGLLPDLSLYALAGWALFVQGISPRIVFDEYYFSPEWQQIFAIDNSFILWGVVLALAVWRKWTLLFVVAGAALLHLITDFPLHHDDARQHFWPLTSWVFHSPVSYWDPAHYGAIAAWVENVLVLALLVVLYRRFKTIWVRCLFGVVAVAQIAPYLVFSLMFAGT